MRNCLLPDKIGIFVLQIIWLKYFSLIRTCVNVHVSCTRKGMVRKNQSTKVWSLSEMIVASRIIVYWWYYPFASFAKLEMKKKQIIAIIDIIRLFSSSTWQHSGTRGSWQQLLYKVRKISLGTASHKAPPFLELKRTFSLLSCQKIKGRVTQQLFQDQ